MVERVSVELVIKDRAGPLRVDELIQFLTYFRAAYAVAAGYESDERGDLKQVIDTGEILAGMLRGWTPAALQASLRGAAVATLSSGKELSFLDIERENPTKIVLVGSISAIVTAVALAGGNIELGPSGVKAWTPGLIQSVANIWKNSDTATGIPSKSIEVPALPAPKLRVDGSGSNAGKPVARPPTPIKRGPKK